MNIAMLHFRVGATDGVSLEMNKWKTVLENLGHRVILIAAEENQTNAIIIKEMSIITEYHRKLFKNCYEEMTDYLSDRELESEVYLQANIIEEKLTYIIKKFQIDLIIPNNISSLGLSLPSGIAIGNVIDKSQIKVIFHHHDFYWERTRYNNPTAPFISELLKKYFPFHNDRTKHCVINEIAKDELLKRRNISAIVVPNVFDFDGPRWKIDNFNQNLKAELGIKHNDIVFLQGTRIEDRKAIELALDVIESIHQKKEQFIGKVLYSKKMFTQDSKIHFVIAGLNEIREDKYKILKNKIDNMSFKTHIIHNMIGFERKIQPEKSYALWDVYTIADYVTYPSILEGWGNQFLEAVFAKKPLLIFEYPVYISDIQKCGFSTVSLGKYYKNNHQGLFTVSKTRIENSANDILDILFHGETYEAIVDKNFTIGKNLFSYKRLTRIMSSIL